MAPPSICRSNSTFWTGSANAHYQAGDGSDQKPPCASSLPVSRMTVNRALRELVAEGWLVRTTAGSGSFVADRRTESPLLAIRNI